MSDDDQDLGPCCACEGSMAVRNLLMLDFEGPAELAGWGCLVCGLPPRGAIAVVCDGCLLEERELKHILGGGRYMSEARRVPIPAPGDRKPFEHDNEKHAEELAPR